MGKERFVRGPYEMIETSSTTFSIQAHYQTGDGKAGYHYLAELDRRVDMSSHFIESSHRYNGILLAASWRLYDRLKDGVRFFRALQAEGLVDAENPMNDEIINGMERALRIARGEDRERFKIRS